MSQYNQHELLREADAPPLLVQMLATGGAAKNKAVQVAAKLHVAVAGQVQTVTEAKAQLRAYFRPQHDATPELQDADFLQWLNDPKEQASREEWAYRFEAVLLVDAPNAVLLSDIFKRTGPRLARSPCPRRQPLGYAGPRKLALLTLISGSYGTMAMRKGNDMCYNSTSKKKPHARREGFY